MPESRARINKPNAPIRMRRFILDWACKTVGHSPIQNFWQRPKRRLKLRRCVDISSEEISGLCFDCRRHVLAAGERLRRANARLGIRGDSGAVHQGLLRRAAPFGYGHGPARIRWEDHRLQSARARRRAFPLETVRGPAPEIRA